jgi:hypothetical protein
MTRLTREIPTDPAHQLKTQNVQNKHTPLQRNEEQEEKRKTFIAKPNSIHSNNQLYYKNSKPYKTKQEQESQTPIKYKIFTST